MTLPLPIIGIVGGIGSGKSFVADLFGELGCVVIKSDDLAKALYNNDGVKATLRQWWGGDVFTPDGTVDRSAVARIIFAQPDQRRRLEELIHPLVNAARDSVMEKHAQDPAVTGFIWDTPLLIETGGHLQCTAVVFVDAPATVRAERVGLHRGWEAGELDRREASQASLATKRAASGYVIVNDGDADRARRQARDVFVKIRATS